MAVMKLNTLRMVSFRLPVDIDRDFRMYLIGEGVGLQHIMEAFCNRVLLYKDGKMLGFEQKLMDSIINEAHKIREAISNDSEAKGATNKRQAGKPRAPSRISRRSGDTSPRSVGVPEKRA